MAGPIGRWQEDAEERKEDAVPVPAQPAPPRLDPAGVLALQRSAGNASVAAALSRRAAPGGVLLRQEDEEEEEGWGEWLARQAKNPWVWVGVGLTALTAGLVYANREAIGEAIAGQAMKHPKLLATGARVLGPKTVAGYAGDALVKGLEKAASTPIESLSPSEHLADAGKALLKIVPGGGLLGAGADVAKAVGDNQEVLATAYEVAKELGPGYVIEVTKEIVKERGGEILVHGINAASRPLIESAAFAYNKVGSPYW